MTMPYPSPQQLAGDTDLYIRDLAYAADGKLSSVVKMFPGSGSAATDANGDIVCDFKAPGVTLTGALILPLSDATYQQQPLISYGKNRNYPPIGSNVQTIAKNPIMLLPREFIVNGGQIWVRVATSPSHFGTEAQYPGIWSGSQPAEAGLTVAWVGFAWSGSSI